MTLLSVCVCTYNRAGLLHDMLESLMSQQNVSPQEILVIDNNSTDATQEVVSRFRSPLIRYCREEPQGLSHARNRALREFRGDYLLFLDDDVRLAPGCLSAYDKAIAAYSSADIFGGRILPDWRREAPAWARERLPLIDGLLVWLDLGETVRPFGEEEGGPYGASFALSRRLVDRVGDFDIMLGCNGEGRARGEETEWFGRALSLGAKRIYVGNALCWHRVDPARLTLAGFFDYGAESGRAYRKITGAVPQGSLVRFFGFAVRGLGQLVKGQTGRFRQCVINMGIEYDALRR